jgi:uncharacterized membrane protein
MIGIIALAIIFLIATPFGITKPLFRHGNNGLRIVITFLYVAFIAQCFDIDYAGSYADAHNLNGASVAWFGTAWVFVLFLTFVALIVCHIALYRNAQRAKIDKT